MAIPSESVPHRAFTGLEIVSEPGFPCSENAMGIGFCGSGSGSGSGSGRGRTVLLEVRRHSSLTHAITFLL
jgi:hypothetical protein